MKNQLHTRWILITLLGILSGCIMPRQYRPVGKFTPLTVQPAPDATDPNSIAVGKEMALPIGAVCGNRKDGETAPLTEAKPVSEKAVESGPCLAFVEYQPSGKRYDQRQMESAEALVRKAIQDDPDHQPVIVGFVHGWKHNANPGDGKNGEVSKWPPEDSNIQGFEHVLNFLYRCYYADPATKDPCLTREKARTPRHGHVVIGIYFSWYAANISGFWPVAQQITVYSRGSEADKVANEGDLSADLEKLSVLAHPSPRRSHEPMFVLVGHSFGARLLEQAIDKPFKDRIAKQIEEGSSVPNFADLVLYVNSAAPARDGIDMLDFLARRHVKFETTSGATKRDQPLLAAITTPADAATGVVFTVAMSPSSLSHTGTQLVECYDPLSESNFQAKIDQRKIFRNTLGHLQEFQSHSLIEISGKDRDTCDGTTPDKFLYWVPGHCFEVSKASPLPGETNRWNGTPYWIMSTDQAIIPDHGTIFTNRLLRLIGHILPDERELAEVSGK